jgi:hypothetical protein
VGIFSRSRFTVTAVTVRPSFAASASSGVVPSRASSSAVHPPTFRRPTGRRPDCFACSARRSSSSSVHSFALIPPAPSSHAAAWAAWLPGVPNLPTPNARRQFHTAFVLTPNQNLSASALSVRIARRTLGPTSSPHPPRVFSGWTRGQEIGASVQLVTRHQARRYLQ